MSETGETVYSDHQQPLCPSLAGFNTSMDKTEAAVVDVGSILIPPYAPPIKTARGRCVALTTHDELKERMSTYMGEVEAQDAIDAFLHIMAGQIGRDRERQVLKNILDNNIRQVDSRTEHGNMQTATFSSWLTLTRNQGLFTEGTVSCLTD